MCYHKVMFEKLIAQMKENAAKAREHSRNHCGGCAHDCPLSNPGCPVGKEAALKKQMREERAAKKAAAKATEQMSADDPANGEGSS